MQAILLVGGYGTRLRPLTLTTPKQMLPVLHRPMIEHAVSGLARHGVDRVVLALGYHDGAFRAAYPDGRCAGVELCCVVEPEPLDTAGAIRFAYESSGMGTPADTFLAANGDVITDLDVGEMLRLHRSAGAEATVHLIEVEDPSRYGVVVTDPDGRARAFVEKPEKSHLSSNWINAGTYLMEPSVIGRIDRGRRVSVEREVFPAMVEAGTLWALRHNTYWVDAGTPRDLPAGSARPARWSARPSPVGGVAGGLGGSWSRGRAQRGDGRSRRGGGRGGAGLRRPFGRGDRGGRDGARLRGGVGRDGRAGRPSGRTGP